MRSTLRNLAAPLAAVGLMGLLAASAHGQSSVKIHATGSLIQQPGGLYALFLEGEASHLGLMTCRGELKLVPGENEGEKKGDGVAAFTAANGDVIVGDVTAHVSSDDALDLRFHWRDCVEFSNGSTACSSGRFERFRPPGAIIYCRWACVQYDGVPVCFVRCSTGDHSR